MGVWFRTHLRRISVRPVALRRVTQAVLELAGQREAHVSLTLVGTIRMRGLNRKFRQRDYPTDVLAFPMSTILKSSHVFLGDVVICLPLALAQANKFQNTGDEEILRLIIHGILHLLGYDHAHNTRDAQRMFRKEHTIFQQLRPVPQLLA